MMRAMNPDRLPCPLARNPRATLAFIALACFGLIGGGVVLQATVNVQPCPLCVFQRYAYIVTGLLAMAGAMHAGTYRVSRIYAGLTTLAALVGAGIAARQVWLQHNPPAVSECGADLEFMLESFPLTQALPMVFRGTGDCSKVDWTLLGFSIAELSLAAFAVLAACALALAADRYAGRH
jgi:disulfide bond formation protein DsbB